VFELTEAQIEEFAVYKASYLPEQIRTSRTFLPAIREHVRSLSELAEPTVCARRQEFIKSELDVDEFRERVLLQDGAKVIVGGVRFKNLDSKFPFVELNANFDLFDSTVIEDAASVARQQFDSFAPKGILIVGAPEIAVSTAIERWGHTVGGRSTRRAKRAKMAPIRRGFANQEIRARFCASR
jgi:hypothetical protein